MVDIETVLQAHVQPMHDKKQLVSTLWEQPTIWLQHLMMQAFQNKNNWCLYTVLDESEFLINTLYVALTFRH